MDIQKKQKVKEETVSWIKSIIIALIIAWLINSFIIINAKVPSGSMENTIITGDRLIANRLSYTFGEPERLDIIVFESPDNEEILFVKRVIGLPGDTIEIIKGELFINGELTEEPYVKEEPYGSFGPYIVPEEHYFMMGDNRNNSDDARFWDNTYLSEDAIKGKAIFRYYPTPKLYINHSENK